MKCLFLAPPALALILFGLSSPLAGIGPPARKPDPTRPVRPLAITGVTVIDATGAAPQPDMTVVVRGERIVTVAKTASVKLPAEARVIDGRGKYLIPGLWDMHAHVVHDRFRELFLAHGVTGVRHMFTPSPLYSPAGWRKLKATAPAPRLALSDSMLDGHRPTIPLWARRHVHPAAGARAARQAVRASKARGDDFIKIYNDLSREAFLGAIDEARAQRLPVVGHVPNAVSVAEASDMGMRSVEHLSGVALVCSSREETLRAEMLREVEAGRLPPLQAAIRYQTLAYHSLDRAKAERLFRRLARNGTCQVPTLVQKRVWSRLGETSFTRDDRLASLPAMVRTLWRVERTEEGIVLPGMGVRVSHAELIENRRELRKDLEIVEMMHRAKVPLLAGTDTPVPYVFPGSGLHDELELLVEAGLRPMDALQAATRNPAEYLGRLSDLGTVEKGKLADLVLLDADPLKYIGHIRRIAAVIQAGRLLDRRALDGFHGLTVARRPGG